MASPSSPASDSAQPDPPSGPVFPTPFTADASGAALPQSRPPLGLGPVFPSFPIPFTNDHIMPQSSANCDPMQPSSVNCDAMQPGSVNCEAMADSPRPQKRKRLSLSLEERVTVLQQKASGMSASAIAKILGCGKTQIQNIIKNRAPIIELWQSGQGRADQKRIKNRKLPYDKLDQMTFNWFCELRSKNLPVTGKMIQDKALLFSQELGQDDFRASNGWLARWKARHSEQISVMAGESGEAGPDAAAVAALARCGQPVFPGDALAADADDTAADADSIPASLDEDSLRIKTEAGDIIRDQSPTDDPVSPTEEVDVKEEPVFQYQDGDEGMYANEEEGPEEGEIPRTDPRPRPAIPSSSTVHNYLEQCVDYAIHQNQPELLTHLTMALHVLDRTRWMKSGQTRITNFFS